MYGKVLPLALLRRMQLIITNHQMANKIEAEKDKVAIESIKESAKPFDYQSMKLTEEDLRDERSVTAGIKGIMILKNQISNAPKSR
jgi:hypothetical protein